MTSSARTGNDSGTCGDGPRRKQAREGVENFNYKFVDWADLPAPPAAVPKLDVARNGQGVPGGASAERLKASLAHTSALNGLE